MKQESNILKNEKSTSTEITDDIDVIGPGRMLAEARECMGLSQQQVADKLNFRKTLVQEIEAEQFDLSLPSAFNRGYLKNYAKLVNISQDDVLNSYDQLGVAQRQCAEMQSFSKGTEKQAEHNMLMWITYLIIVSLIIATIVWWYQAPSVQPTVITVDATEPVESEILSTSAQNTNAITVQQANNQADNAALKPSDSAHEVEQDSEFNTTINNDITASDNITDTPSESSQVTLSQSATQNLAALNNIEPAEPPITTQPVANVVFSFSGDCWVNIYDASGKRIAWGVKKSGYVMRISGQAPFKVTLGKPELVNIEYNDVAVDMSDFNAGNIAKFSLPLTP